MLQYLKDFVSLLYPEVCLCCGEGLVKQEEFVCTTCMFKLPKTNFHLQPDNVLANTFIGRVDITTAAAYCYYQKEGMVQDLVHQLKYNGKKELGNHLGKWYGQDLKQAEPFSRVEVVIPVPLHKLKQRKRGYNQSAQFATGLAQSMSIECCEDVLIRVKNSETQTNKTRYERWENVKDIFGIQNKERIEGKHVLLVDDIVTTGATTEACSHALRSAGVASLCVASIGFTNIV